MTSRRPPQTSPSISSAEQASYQIVRTGPDEILRHDISDDELTRLGEGKSSHLSAAFWVFIGAALGGAAGGLGALAKYLGDQTVPMEMGALFQIIFLFVMTALALGAGLVLKAHGSPSENLREQIRARSKKTAI